MKEKILFECIECGYQSLKFYGKCPQCENWNSMVEIEPEKKKREQHISQFVKPIWLTKISKLEQARLKTGLNEFDRTLGGGIVPNSVILIGGEPGVGKSTLLLELSGHLSCNKCNILYYSGEESAIQIKIRADRLGIDPQHIQLLTMANLEDLVHTAQEEKPAILIVDSIQTITSSQGPLIAGSISAVRYVTDRLIQMAKQNNITVFIIGHITKEGQIAGPKTLEHMVDTVLNFHGEVKTDLRILRVEKNRFGPVDEIGIFQMTAKGLSPIADPSLLFIQHRTASEPGISILPLMSGQRSILIEIQALVSESSMVGNPRRISVGFDGYRTSMLIAIIEKKLKLPFYKSDVFLNITGGMVIKETAADLAIISALISSYKNLPVPTNIMVIGEVGLTGEIRPVNFMDNRIKEGIRQGFSRFIVPSAQGDIQKNDKMTVFPVDNLYQFYDTIKELI